MTAVEPWPTEAAATVAVEAIARKAYENIAGAFPGYPTWEQAEVALKHKTREQVMPIAWSVLEALPDPRRAAWAEGHAQGMEDEIARKRLVVGWTPDNPYPEVTSGEAL
jgi:hypothetical protein